MSKIAKYFHKCFRWKMLQKIIEFVTPVKTSDSTILHFPNEILKIWSLWNICFCLKIWNAIFSQLSSFLELAERKLSRLIYIKNIHSIYIRTVSSSCLICRLGLNWFMGHFSRTTCRVNLIPAHTSQEGIKCTKSK